MRQIPNLVYSDENGRIYDDPDFEMLGQSGRATVPIDPEQLIPLPPGSELFTLPGCLPIGFLRRRKRRKVLNRLPSPAKGRPRAVAAFLSPAYLRLLNTAYATDRKKTAGPVLPLFAYTAVGYAHGRFWVPAVRVDKDSRQELANFDPTAVPRLAEKMVARHPGNRLVEHVAHCATVYRCPAAQNYFYERYEAPLPTSPSCNSACVGCISLQPKEGRVASHDRIRFVPRPEEIRDLAVRHLETAERAMVSFGQGCEGEPLNQGWVLEEAIRLIRKETSKGRIHLNTNGSRPEVVERLMDTGLDSIRVSLNSAIPGTYNAYYKPAGYSFTDVVRSIRSVREGGGYACINLLVFPGVTDQPAEMEALEDLLRSTALQMVQMRNLNIDPELYLETLGIRDRRPGRGVAFLMERLLEARPGLRFGYFNPPAEEIAGNDGSDTAAAPSGQFR